MTRTKLVLAEAQQGDQYPYAYWCLHEKGTNIISFTGKVMGMLGTLVLLLVVIVAIGAPVLVLIPL